MSSLNFFKTLSAWLDYFEHRHRDPIQLGLARFQRALSCFSLNFKGRLVITVGGTNGKGSTVMMLDEIYTSAGYRVGRYMSPHLFRFNERICIQQKEVTDAQLCSLFERIHQHPESLSLTYFEVTTLAALLFFEQEDADIILLEVGMGGRLDATNAIDSDLSIVTTVDFDHEAWLGNTIDAIAFEKAGIFRAQKPAIYADVDPSDTILSSSEKTGSALYCLGSAYQYSVTTENLIVVVGKKKWVLPKPSISSKAAASAIFATLLLQDKKPVTLEHYQAAMERVTMTGRQQWITGEITQLYDVSHNPQSVRSLSECLKSTSVHGVVRAVFSALKDKNLPDLIRPMSEIVHTWYPALLTGPRQTPEKVLRSAFENVNIHVEKCYNSPTEAFKAAWRESRKGDLIVVFGSFLTVSAVLSSQLETVEEKCKHEEACFG